MNKSYPRDTPKPGKRLPAQEEEMTIDEFLTRFRKQGTPAPKRTWDYDHYIFDSQMKWCLAMTHDLPKGIGVIAAGERLQDLEEFMRSAE